MGCYKALLVLPAAVVELDSQDGAFLSLGDLWCSLKCFEV